MIQPLVAETAPNLSLKSIWEAVPIVHTTAHNARVLQTAVEPLGLCVRYV